MESTQAFDRDDLPCGKQAAGFRIASSFWNAGVCSCDADSKLSDSNVQPHLSARTRDTPPAGHGICGSSGLCIPSRSRAHSESPPWSSLGRS
ncbi:MAG: hypothetical protein MZV64_60075 [Ignavibacteriales bacterium]|nr:hypothetical protein [Ignavibacteriales bacterium]